MPDLIQVVEVDKNEALLIEGLLIAISMTMTGNSDKVVIALAQCRKLVTVMGPDQMIRLIDKFVAVRK